MKIYISSTFQDLKEYRDKVYRQLRKMRHDVISMEDYVAGDQRPLAQCLADVAAADIYVGILAWRYGYVPPHDNPDKRSITELEYRQAIDSKKQCLIFLLDKSAPWSPQLMDAHTGDGEAGKSINRFRDELSERHVVAWFSNADQLASDVSAAVYRVQFDTPAPPMPDLSSQRTSAVVSAVPSPARDGKQALPRDGYPKLWRPGDTLRVRFLDGSAKQRHFVERFAPIWSAYANVRFEFTDVPDAEIRVSFKQPGSWSYTGTDALNSGQDQPTANFGWIVDDTRDTEADYTILHEFGHALGLFHEHQNPLAKIPWNKEAVYKIYEGPPNFWSREMVDHTLFSTWDANVFPHKKPFDRDSIMAFPIPSKFTTGDFEIGQNRTLSLGDKEFIALLYPYDETKSRKQPSSAKRNKRRTNPTAKD